MKTLIKYAIVGASGLVVSTICLYSLTEFVGLYYMLSAVIASEISIITNFLLNDKFTFSTDGVRHTKIERFFIYNGVAVVGTAALLSITFALTEFASMYYIYANWMGMLSGFVINFGLNKTVTWRKNGFK